MDWAAPLPAASRAKNTRDSDFSDVRVQLVGAFAFYLFHPVFPFFGLKSVLQNEASVSGQATSVFISLFKLGKP